LTFYSYLSRINSICPQINTPVFELFPCHRERQNGVPEFPKPIGSPRGFFRRTGRRSVPRAEISGCIAGRATFGHRNPARTKKNGERKNSDTSNYFPEFQFFP
jgi:hypothetical protein